MKLNLPLDRLDDRRALLNGFDQLKAGMEAEGESVDAARQKAFSILLGGVGEAFDLDEGRREDASRSTTPRSCST